MPNIKRIQATMAEKGIKALLLTDELDRQYACGFHTSDGCVLILPDFACFITDSRYIEAARESIRDAQVLMSDAENSQNRILRSIIEERGIDEVGVQEFSLSFGGYLSLESELGVKFLPAQEITQSLRQTKQQYEVDNIVAAQRISEKALDYVLGFIKDGLTEREIAAELEYRMAKNGAQGLAFETICVSGENSSLPHGVPSDRKVRMGDFITMDFGCKVNGYCSDMTRTVALGSVTDEMKKVYETVLDSQLTGIAAARAGITGKTVDRAARDIIEKAGYGKYFGHGLGHSVGLFIHEDPNTNTRDERILPVGAVITSEPGIYLPGRFGVRIEDMLLLTETGCVNLTEAPKNLIIL